LEWGGTTQEDEENYVIKSLLNNLLYKTTPKTLESIPGKIILDIFFKAVSLDRRQSSGVRSSSFTAKNL